MNTESEIYIVSLKWCFITRFGGKHVRLANKANTGESFLFKGSFDVINNAQDGSVMTRGRASGMMLGCSNFYVS